jgi:hypothetical protein
MRARTHTHTHTHTHTRLLKRNLVAGSTATLARPRHSIALRPISKLASVLQGDGGPGKALDQGALDGVGGQEPSSPTRPMIPMRSATTSSSAAFAPSSRQDRTATKTVCYNERLYRQRNCIERALGHLKINRATRYDQLADSFLGMLYLGTARYWIKFVHAT